MNNEDLKKYKQIIIDNFRWIKLEKDYAQFQLLQFQIIDLITHYEKLINLQEEIQSKHYQTFKQLEENNIKKNFDYVTWHQEKQNEISQWKHELDILTEYKHQLTFILNQIEDGSVEKSLVEEEKEFLETLDEEID